MLWAKKVLRITAAIVVAIAAAHTAESRKGQAAQQSVLLTASQQDPGAASVAMASVGAVPRSASLNGSTGAVIGDLLGITPVAATMPAAGGDDCRPAMQLAAVSGAMIQLSLSAPCNRNERIVIRHSGLSFTTRTAADGTARLLFPALKPEATVAVYLSNAHLVLGNVAVPEVASYARYAVMWEWPAELELRVTEGGKVLVGTAVSFGSDQQRVMSLGSVEVQSPVLANVYSVPGKDLGLADLTAELRITPASCGRTLRLDTVYSAGGQAIVQEQEVAVPLCGTAGDILLLKNLVPAPTLAAPK